MDKVKNSEERLWYAEKALEKDVENALVSNITDLLLELGNGFAFIGRQYHFMQRWTQVNSWISFERYK